MYYNFYVPLIDNSLNEGKGIFKSENKLLKSVATILHNEPGKMLWIVCNNNNILKTRLLIKYIKVLSILYLVYTNL